jgi:hypothetical protein
MKYRLVLVVVAMMLMGRTGIFAQEVNSNSNTKAALPPQWDGASCTRFAQNSTTNVGVKTAASALFTLQTKTDVAHVGRGNI